MDQSSVTRVDRGPGTVARQVVVNAEPGEIFAILANPHRHHEVDGSGTVKPEVIGPRELQQGDRFRVSMKMFGVPYAMTSTVTRLKTDRLVEWQHPAGHRWRWELEPVEGGTRVTEVFDHADSREFVLRLIRADDTNASGIEKTLRRLQQRFATS